MVTKQWVPYCQKQEFSNMSWIEESVGLSDFPVLINSTWNSNFLKTNVWFWMYSLLAANTWAIWVIESFNFYSKSRSKLKPAMLWLLSRPFNAHFFLFTRTLFRLTPIISPKIFKNYNFFMSNALFGIRRFDFLIKL